MTSNTNIVTNVTEIKAVAEAANSTANSDEISTQGGSAQTNCNQI